jgi:hypothetical protein
MVSDDDATPVVVIPVDVSVGTSVAGYVVVMDDYINNNSDRFDT